MDNATNLLITVTNGELLTRIALKLKFDLPGDVLENPLKPTNKDYLYSLLSNYICQDEKIVNVETINEIIILIKMYKG